MDRRTSIKWMMAAVSAANLSSWAASPSTPATSYGTDPDLVRKYRSGELWPLTFTAEQKITAAALCALILPADAHSPSAAQLNVHLFIDEWISAPYPRHVSDREKILEGLAWIEGDAAKRFKKSFAQLTEAQQRNICDPVCNADKVTSASPELLKAAKFFSRYRDLTADGFYTTPEGMKDLGFTGNKPSAKFDGPPLAALKKAGLA
ncbi:MAG: gluconate 2-dehydrogenase subunit 3 family protein [Betaproteobacteria bacterium]